MNDEYQHPSKWNRNGSDYHEGRPSQADLTVFAQCWDTGEAGWLYDRVFDGEIRRFFTKSAKETGCPFWQ